MPAGLTERSGGRSVTAPTKPIGDAVDSLDLVRRASAG